MDNQKQFFEFQRLCKSLVPASKHELLEKLCAKQDKLYKEANPDFVASDEFGTILKRHLENLNGEKGEKEVFKSFWDLNQVLKGVKKTKLETLQNGTGDTNDIEMEKHNNVNDTQEGPSTSGSSDSGQNVASEAGGSSRDDKNQRRIEKLEKKLGKLHRAIQKLSEKELSLDEMEDECSIHIQEHRLRNRFVKGWEMLCKLKKISSATGRAKESTLVYRGSNYKEINVKVTKLINKPDHFPDYQEVLNLIEKVNEKKELGIDEVELGVLAREVFVDIGNQLKGRRQQDLLQSFGYANLAMADDDPAEVCEELRVKLKENEQLSSKKLSDELDKFSREQRMREARGEDLEAASEDEEEDIENDDLDKDDDKFDKLNDDDSDEEESPSSTDEPATKKVKRDSPCEDGIHCGTDSELSDNQESHANTAKIVPSIRLKQCEMETETSDIDFFLARDETATILTSGDESIIQGDGKTEHENESDLSSLPSVVSLSDDDSDDERDSSLDSNAEGMVSSLNRTEGHYIPTQSEVYAQRSNGCHRDVDSSLTSGRGSSKNTLQADHYGKPVPNHSNGTAASKTAKNWDADSAYLSNDQLIESDPIDELGEEGLVPVAECHSYAFVGRSHSGIQSAGTAAPKQGEPDADNDYIEIIDSSGSSPSPTVPETERESSKQDQDVIVISDSD
ncbi:Death domain-associated protein 6 [Holothuria leucospilota]|uniref:Death domain-associated protein 6 n=1 Tax=Holothuria leucospilota TaxID=206669 RepID=A0A9Q1C711_HOLLE|nr:Death domain-associated protein 6 [Holothuria leucospilota]